MFEYFHSAVVAGVQSVCTCLH